MLMTHGCTAAAPEAFTCSPSGFVAASTASGAFSALRTAFSFWLGFCLGFCRGFVLVGSGASASLSLSDSSRMATWAAVHSIPS
jgi:hypothetical protein